MVDVSCLLTTRTSSGVRPRPFKERARAELVPPRPAASAPSPGAGDGGVDAVGVGLCVGNHSVDGQSELGGDVATREEDGASAFGFDEACAAAVVGA